MGLQLAKTVKGHSCNYWRWVQQSSNFDRNDAVWTLALYKDKATRDADRSAVMEPYQVDLGEDFHNAINSESENMKDKKRKTAYTVFKAKAQAEAEKTEEKNDSLAWFADAVDA